MDHINIFGFAGSLRRNSYNKFLLKAAKERLPENASLEIFDLEGIPLFNQDNENNQVEKVREFKQKIREADAILIATPEYNYTIPGVLTNALNNATRPYGDNAFDGKPCAIMGASISLLGTSRAQYHLRQTCVTLNMYPLNNPEVMVMSAQTKFNNEGYLYDQTTQELLGQLMYNLVDWTLRFKKVQHEVLY
jgi:chromate reductase